MRMPRHDLDAGFIVPNPEGCTQTFRGKCPIGDGIDQGRNRYCDGRMVDMGDMLMEYEAITQEDPEGQHCRPFDERMFEYWRNVARVICASNDHPIRAADIDAFLYDEYGLPKDDIGTQHR
jgi:hypothetical protein